MIKSKIKDKKGKFKSFLPAFLEKAILSNRAFYYQPGTIIIGKGGKVIKPGGIGSWIIDGKKFVGVGG